MLRILSFILLPTLYRVAGSDVKIPGKKALRRFGIPAFIAYVGAVVGLTWVEITSSCGIMALILCFNLDEIEEKDWDDVFCYGMALSACFYPFSGIYSYIVGLWWTGGVLLSNVQLGPYHKLDWKYVEVGMGIAMATALTLGGKL